MVFSAVMLSDTLYRHPREEGFHCLQQRGERGARELTTLRLCLPPGQTADYVCVDEETVLVLLQGSGVAAFGLGERRISRRGVFDEPATAIYLPPGQALHVSADESLEAILVSTPAAAGSAPALATPSDVAVNPRGRDTYFREVHDIFVRDPHVVRLMVGEVFTPPGHWSSFPPHKHDGRDGEPRQEEVYYFRVDRRQGFGHQVLYTNDGEAVTHQVSDGDLVLIPYGYHPVSAPPGYRLYYLWAMAGDVRQLAPYEDPAHRWIHDPPPS
jgi:5-deoxy-glucuronate isomerase